MSRPMRTTALRAVVAALVGTLVVVTTPADAAPVKTYQAPFAAGPNGGDQWSYHSAGTDGTITVGRVYPVPGAINCTKGGPYAKLLIQHRATRPVKKLVLHYDTAAVDNFTFLLLGLRNGHRWLGTTSARGVLTGSGTVTLRPDRRQGRMPRVLTIEFGLQQSSACPNADIGTVHVSSIQVFS